MAEGSEYWKRRALSRRAMLRGAGLGVAGLAGAALIGCSSQDASPSTGSGGAATGGTGAAGGAAGSGIPANVERAPGFDPSLGLVNVNEKKVKQGGTFRYATTTNRYEQDPDLTGNISDHQWQNDRLFFANGWTGEIIPDLLESYEVVSPEEIVLTLRAGVKTFDRAPTNGRVLTASDVALSINRKAGLLDPADKARFARSSQYFGLARAEAIDDRVVKLVMASPNGSILTAFTDSRAQVFPKEQLDVGFADPVKAVGTGAWMMTELVDGTRTVFKANPNYYREWDEGGRPGYDTFEKLVLPDRSAQLSAFITGDVTTLQSIQPFELAQVRASVREAQFFANPNLLWDHFAVNTRLPMFADERVRNALKLAFDYKALADPTGEGWVYSSPLHAMFPESMSPADVAKLPGFNPATKEQDRVEARRLIDAAGYVEGAGIKFEFNQSGATGTTFDRAVRMQEQLSTVFPKMVTTIVPVTDFAAYNSMLSSGQFQSRSYVHLAVPDVSLEANTYYHSKGSRNYQAYSKPWIDETLDKLKVAFGVDERRELVRAFETRYLQEGPALWATHIPRSMAAYQANSGGEDLVGVSGTWANGHTAYGITYRWLWQTE